MAYTEATAEDLKLRYPEFDSVPDQRVAYWLSDARTRTVKDGDWSDPDGPVAQMLVAAHSLAMEGDGATNGDGVPVGVTSMRSGSLSLSFDAGHVANVAGGGFTATRYGSQFLALLKSYRAGPRVTQGGFPGRDCQDVYGRSFIGGGL